MPPISKQTLLEAFHFRCAMRHFDSERKISAEDFDCLLEVARLSPSSVGYEPWQFVVLQNRTLREALKPYAWGMTKQLDNASHIVVFLAEKNARYDNPDFRQVLSKRGLNEAQIEQSLVVYQKFQQQDIRVLESERSLFDWASKQTYIALANMMTGAALLGIDSCPVEGFDYAEVNRILAEAGVFDPKKYAVSVIAAFGYRSKEPRTKQRKPIEDVVKWVE